MPCSKNMCGKAELRSDKSRIVPSNSSKALLRSGCAGLLIAPRSVFEVHYISARLRKDIAGNQTPLVHNPDFKNFDRLEYH